MNARRLWIGLFALAVLTPLGLWLPERLRAGDAWGEWPVEDLGRQVGYVPQGMARAADHWSAPIPDYAPRGWGNRPLAHVGLAYVGSALLGIALCAGTAWALGRWLSRRETRGRDAA